MWKDVEKMSIAEAIEQLEPIANFDRESYNSTPELVRAAQIAVTALRILDPYSEETKMCALMCEGEE